MIEFKHSHFVCFGICQAYPSAEHKMFCLDFMKSNQIIKLVRCMDSTNLFELQTIYSGYYNSLSNYY